MAYSNTRSYIQPSSTPDLLSVPVVGSALPQHAIDQMLAFHDAFLDVGMLNIDSSIAVGVSDSFPTVYGASSKSLCVKCYKHPNQNKDVYIFVRWGLKHDASSEVINYAGVNKLNDLIPSIYFSETPILNVDLFHASFQNNLNSTMTGTRTVRAFCDQDTFWVTVSRTRTVPIKVSTAHLNNMIYQYGGDGFTCLSFLYDKVSLFKVYLKIFGTFNYINCGLAFSADLNPFFIFSPGTYSSENRYSINNGGAAYNGRYTKDISLMGSLTGERNNLNYQTFIRKDGKTNYLDLYSHTLNKVDDKKANKLHIFVDGEYHDTGLYCANPLSMQQDGVYTIGGTKYIAGLDFGELNLATRKTNDRLISASLDSNTSTDIDTSTFIHPLLPIE